MEDVRRMSDRELLAELIGKRNAARVLATPLLPQLQSGRPSKELRCLIVAQEIWQRLCIQDLTTREVLGSPEAVKSYLFTVYATKPYEVFVVLFLDAQNRLIAAEEMFRGTLTQTSVYPREVVVRALEHRAASVILSHNHPSGCPQPSRADEALTHTLKAALALVDVRVLDHVVWAVGATLSFAEIGLF
jgi:DNA repair protein RadC